MTTKACLCGADADIKHETRTGTDGRTETFYWVSCPVCGQIGPKISAGGKDEKTAIAEAIDAWNAMLIRARPALA